MNRELKESTVSLEIMRNDHFKELQSQSCLFCAKRHGVFPYIVVQHFQSFYRLCARVADHMRNVRDIKFRKTHVFRPIFYSSVELQGYTICIILVNYHLVGQVRLFCLNKSSLFICKLKCSITY